MVKISKTEKILLGITAIFLLGVMLCFFLSSAGGEEAGYTVTTQRQTDWQLTEPEKIDLNTADAEELQTLDGIGEILAGRIIARRESAGPYRTVEDLLEVEGIGQATLERFRHQVCIEEDE